MDAIENIEIPSVSFPKELGKAFLTTTATTAGVLVGFVIVGLAASKIQEIQKNRRAKKAATSN